MARPKPIGWDNFRTLSFISNDGSGFSMFRKASFTKIDGSFHKIFSGPSIASTNVNADCTITTSEAHGFTVGQAVMIYGLPSPVSGILNGAQIVTSVPSSTTFKVGLDTSSSSATSNVGIVGVDTDASVPTANYASLPGALCNDDYPEAWEGPLVG